MIALGLPAFLSVIDIEDVWNLYQPACIFGNFLSISYPVVSTTVNYLILDIIYKPTKKPRDLSLIGYREIANRGSMINTIGLP